MHFKKKIKEKVKRVKKGSYFLNKFLENLFLKGKSRRIFFFLLKNYVSIGFGLNIKYNKKQSESF